MCEVAVAVRRHLLDAHADRRPRRVRIGGGGDRDRTARQGAGGHHSSQDRRASNVGTDAGADRHHRRGAGARPGRAGQRLSVSRRAEQSLQHHSAVGARGRLAGDDQAAEGSGAAPAPRKRNQQRHPRHQLVQPLHRHRRLGRHAAGVALESQVQAVRRQAHERRDQDARQAGHRRAVRAARTTTAAPCRRSTSTTPKTTCATR